MDPTPAAAPFHEEAPPLQQRRRRFSLVLRESSTMVGDVSSARSRHRVQFGLDTARWRSILSGMSTVAEILEAVRHLAPQEKQELVEQLESVLIEPRVERSACESQDYCSPEFTA